MPKKKKIIVDARAIQHSARRGLGRYTCNLIDNLMKLDSGFDFTLYFDPNDKIEDEFKRFLELPHVFGIKQPFFMKKDSVFYGRYWLKKQFSSLDYDLIHFSSQIHMPPTLPNNSIISVHDLINLALKDMFYKIGIAHAADVRYTRNMLKNALKIIVPSLNTKNDLINILKIDAEKITIITEGVEEHFFNNYSKKEISSTLAKFNIRGEYLFYFGGCETRKNVASLINVFSALIKEFPNLKLVIVSNLNDDPTKKIIAQAHQLGIANQIIFVGHVSDQELAILLKAAKLFVMPSLYEGFGLPPLEANACGTPVVSSNAASLPEVLGEAAVFFDPLNQKEMYNNIKEVLTNETLRNFLINQGLKNVERFSWRKCAEETVRVYGESV